MKRLRRLVMDTNIFVSALRSRRGPSFRFLSLVGEGRFELYLSVPLILEYEQVARRERWPNKPGWRHIEDILDYLCAAANHQKVHFLWRPRERDPKDDMVLELAVAAQCDGIVTHNKRDFGEAQSFGLKLYTPREFLAAIGEQP